MIQGDADVEWKQTNVFVHLRRLFNVSEEVPSFTKASLHTDNKPRMSIIG